MTRRDFLASLPMAAIATRAALCSPKTGSTFRILFGTGTQGIFLADFNAATGEVGPLYPAADIHAPSFLALRSNGQQSYVYALSEGSEAEAQLTAFTLQRSGSSLEKLNAVSAGGDGPAHVAISPHGHAVFCANYGGGSISSFRVLPNGGLSDCVSHLQFQGSGLRKGSQSKPHTHAANPSPDGKWLLVNDLSLDRIFIFHLEEHTAKLTPASPPFWAATPGSGPRHLSFHPNGKWVYSVNELNSTVDFLQWDSHQGTLTCKQTISTLPADFPPDTAFAGEVLCSADGRFVYAGNRVANDTIAVFSVDHHTGTLSLVQLAANPGKNPRHVALDPTQRWVILSDLGSGQIAVLARDGKSGRLSDTGHIYKLDGVEFAGFVQA